MTDAALPGSMFLKTKPSSAANQLSNTGKRATNASATVAIGTTASNVVNERLLAVRARPKSRIRMPTRQTKRNGFKAGWPKRDGVSDRAGCAGHWVHWRLSQNAALFPPQRKLMAPIRDSFTCHNGATR